jgi:hypothetical protein
VKIEHLQLTSKPDKTVTSIIEATATMTVTIKFLRHTRNCTRCQCDAPGPTGAQVSAMASKAGGTYGYFFLAGRYVDIKEHPDGWNEYLPEGWDFFNHELFCPGCAQYVKAAMIVAMRVET